MPESTVNLAATAVRNYGKNSFKLQPFEHIYTTNTGNADMAFGTAQINPGSTWKITTSILARLNTSRYPTIARGWIQYSWWYIPHWQIWDHANECFLGQNEESAWYSPTTYTVPKMTIPANDPVAHGTWLDMAGVPTGLANTEINELLHRAYMWVIDQYWRDQNIEAPLAPNTGDTGITYQSTGDITKAGQPYQINRKADYFSTCLPEPQRGPETLLPLGSIAPVIGNGTTIGLTNGTNTAGLSNGTSGGAGAVKGISGAYGKPVGNTSSNTVISAVASYGLSTDATKSGMIADLSSATAASILDVRQAIVTQHIFERDARSGARGPELLWARWGVEVDPLEMGRPRLLTMGRFPIDFEQVPQTSATQSGGTEQGTLTAFGYTNNRSDEETFSFKYHGSLICIVAIRFEHMYQQGLRQEWVKSGRFDWWNPEFMGLGDQPVYDYEIYATGGTSGTITTKSIFGYQIRGAEYLNYPSLISGQARSDYSQSMDYVHLADEYASLPTLSTAWMKENPDNLDRTIFVSSNIADQWLVDFVAEFEITDTLPQFSIPGIDRI